MFEKECQYFENDVVLTNTLKIYKIKVSNKKFIQKIIVQFRYK